MDDQKMARKVSEIFTAAGQAFTKLAELTMQINPDVEAPPGTKWTDDEVEMLRNAIQSFGMDLNKISEVVKTRSITQLKSAIKRKIYEEAGVPLSKKQQQSKKRQSATNNSLANDSTTTETVSFDDFASNLEPGKAKKAKLTEKSTANGSEAVVDVENVDNSRNSYKKLDRFMSTPVRQSAGGVSDLSVSHPPPLPPFDLVSDPS